MIFEKVRPEDVVFGDSLGEGNIIIPICINFSILYQAPSVMFVLAGSSMIRTRSMPLRP